MAPRWLELVDRGTLGLLWRPGTLGLELVHGLGHAGDAPAAGGGHVGWAGAQLEAGIGCGGPAAARVHAALKPVDELLVFLLPPRCCLEPRPGEACTLHQGHPWVDILRLAPGPGPSSIAWLPFGCGTLRAR